MSILTSKLSRNVVWFITNLLFTCKVLEENKAESTVPPPPPPPLANGTLISLGPSDNNSERRDPTEFLYKHSFNESSINYVHTKNAFKLIFLYVFFKSRALFSSPLLHHLLLSGHLLGR